MAKIDAARYEDPSGEEFHACPHAATNGKLREDEIAFSEYEDHERAVEDFCMFPDIHTLVVKVGSVEHLGSHHERYMEMSRIMLEVMESVGASYDQSEILQIVQGPCYDKKGFESRYADSYQIVLNKMEVFGELTGRVKDETREVYEAVCGFPLSTFMPDPDNPNDSQYYQIFV